MYKTWQHWVLCNTNPVPAYPVSAISTSIANITAAVPLGMLATTNMERRVVLYLQEEGNKFQHFLYQNYLHICQGLY
jgi:hypothetical protein